MTTAPEPLNLEALSEELDGLMTLAIKSPEACQPIAWKVIDQAEQLITELREARRIILNIEALRAQWQRNETRTAEYQDGLADAADQVSAVFRD